MDDCNRGGRGAGRESRDALRLREPGRVRSQAMPGSARTRGYARDDVERLRQRTEERRAPDKAAARSLQWGLPVLESSIALIDGRRLFYRGHDAVTLARARSLQEVASLIWTGGFGASAGDPAPARPDARHRSRGRHSSPVRRRCWRWQPPATRRRSIRARIRWRAPGGGFCGCSSTPPRRGCLAQPPSRRRWREPGVWIHAPPISCAPPWCCAPTTS